MSRIMLSFLLGLSSPGLPVPVAIAQDSLSATNSGLISITGSFQGAQMASPEGGTLSISGEGASVRSSLRREGGGTGTGLWPLQGVHGQAANSGDVTVNGQFSGTAARPTPGASPQAFSVQAVGALITYSVQSD